MLLPDLTRLCIDISTTKRKHVGEDGPDAGADADAAQATDAEELLNVLKALPSDSRSIDWVLKLSNAQFDMLLSMRLYTGSLYQIMALVFVDDGHDAESTKELLVRSMSSDHIDVALYFALCNWKRRRAAAAAVAAAAEDASPLLVAELGETRHLDMTEATFRTSAAVVLTDHSVAEFLPEPVRDTSTIVFSRVAGRGRFFDEMQHTAEFKTEWSRNKSALTKQALEDFWSAMRHTASALRALILESKVVVEGGAIPVYRGMREGLVNKRAEASFVSVSRSEQTARWFTSNKDLDYEDAEVGAPKQCCMLRISLLPGTPYLDIEAALKNSKGWGFSLGEEELVLPPGLEWKDVAKELANKEDDEQIADFPEEINESHFAAPFRRFVEAYYDVEYYKVGPSSGADDLRGRPRKQGWEPR